MYTAQPALQLPLLLLGLAMLFGGRKLFWLFLGAGGFLLGMTTLGHYQLDPTVLLVACSILGIVGVFIALLIANVAVKVAGLVGGAYFAMGAYELFYPQFGLPAEYWWIAALGGGILGIILISILFHWGLIILSSLLGSALIINQTIDVPQNLEMPALVILILLGVTVQGCLFRASRSESAPKGSEKSAKKD